MHSRYSVKLCKKDSESSPASGFWRKRGGQRKGKTITNTLKQRHTLINKTSFTKRLCRALLKLIGSYWLQQYQQSAEENETWVTWIMGLGVAIQFHLTLRIASKAGTVWTWLYHWRTGICLLGRSCCHARTTLQLDFLWNLLCFEIWWSNGSIISGCVVPSYMNYASMSNLKTDIPMVWGLIHQQIEIFWQLCSRLLLVDRDITSALIRLN